MIIENLYKPLLQSVNAVADEAGLLTWQEGDQPGRPLIIDERRMALPVREQLSRPNPAVILFHPLSESTTRGESKVLQKLMSLIRLRLGSSLLSLLNYSTQLCADHDTNRKLSPEASVMLACLPEADKRTVEDMESILAALEADPDKLVKIYLKRGGHYHGKKMSRVAVVTFPVWGQFEDDTRSVYGVNLRKKDYVGFKKLLEWILPQIDENEGYNAGSMAMTAPYLDSLVQSYLKVARDINRAAKTILKQLADPDSVLIDIDWEEDARDLSVYRDDIPALEDSMGTPVNAQGVETTAAAVQAVTAGASTLFPKKMTAGADALLADRPATGGDEFAHRRPAHHTAAATPAPAAEEDTGRVGGVRSVTEVMALRRQQQEEAQRAAMGYPPAGQHGHMHPAHGHHPHHAPQHHYAPTPAPAAPGEYPGYHRGVPVQPMNAGYGYNTGYGTAPGYGYQNAVAVDPNAMGAANAYGTVAAPNPYAAYGGYGQPAPAPGYGGYGGGYPAPGVPYGGYPSAV